MAHEHSHDPTLAKGQNEQSRDDQFQDRSAPTALTFPGSFSLSKRRSASRRIAPWRSRLRRLSERTGPPTDLDQIQTGGHTRAEAASHHLDKSKALLQPTPRGPPSSHSNRDSAASPKALLELDRPAPLGLHGEILAADNPSLLTRLYFENGSLRVIDEKAIPHTKSKAATEAVRFSRRGRRGPKSGEGRGWPPAVGARESEVVGLSEHFSEDGRPQTFTKSPAKTTVTAAEKSMSEFSNTKRMSTGRGLDSERKIRIFLGFLLTTALRGAKK
jgi:hypothetical protein